MSFNFRTFVLDSVINRVILQNRTSVHTVLANLTSKTYVQLVVIIKKATV